MWSVSGSLEESPILGASPTKFWRASHVFCTFGKLITNLIKVKIMIFMVFRDKSCLITLMTILKYFGYIYEKNFMEKYTYKKYVLLHFTI